MQYSNILAVLELEMVHKDMKLFFKASSLENCKCIAFELKMNLKLINRLKTN